MYQIIVGSMNKTKIAAVKIHFPNDIVQARDVPSNVRVQPFGDKETREGAINRAHSAYEFLHGNKGIAIGLEGGVMTIGERLFLNNWGALVDPAGKIFTAAGARIELPKKFIRELEAGHELSVIMDAYAQKKDIRNHQGAIGIFTNEQIDRTEMFSHVVALLKGQMAYWGEGT